ncbi:MAG: hypothetical protein MUE69_32925 [Myxococcota bacterium]|nr:hypothetical protein [Myxococcota bacterium]
MSRRVGRQTRAARRAALVCLLATSALASICAALPSRAHAQRESVRAPSLEGAEASLENAEFESALVALGALESDESLGFSRDELARLLRLRAVALSALGRDDEARASLRALSTLLEGAEPGALPPTLLAIYREVRDETPLSVRVVLVRDVGEQVRASVQVEGDPAGLVRHLVLRCAIDENEVARTRGDRLVVRAADGLSCAVDAVGPAGHALAHHDARWVGAASDDAFNPYEEPPPRRRVGALVGGLVAAVTVVVGAVVLGVMLSQRGAGLDGPTWEDTP